MISFVSLALAAYQGAALRLGLPRLSDLSHRWPWGLLVWAWWVVLGVHFLEEARESRYRGQ